MPLANSTCTEAHGDEIPHRWPGPGKTHDPPGAWRRRPDGFPGDDERREGAGGLRIPRRALRIRLHGRPPQRSRPKATAPRRQARPGIPRRGRRARTFVARHARCGWPPRRAAGFGNIETVQAPAEHLPFDAGHFRFSSPAAFRRASLAWISPRARRGAPGAERRRAAVFIDVHSNGPPLFDTISRPSSCCAIPRMSATTPSPNGRLPSTGQGSR